MHAHVEQEVEALFGQLWLWTELCNVIQLGPTTCIN